MQTATCTTALGPRDSYEQLSALERHPALRHSFVQGFRTIKLCICKPLQARIIMSSILQMACKAVSVAGQPARMASPHLISYAWIQQTHVCCRACVEAPTRSPYLGLPSLSVSCDANLLEATAISKHFVQLPIFYILRQAPHKCCALVCVDRAARSAGLCTVRLCFCLHYQHLSDTVTKTEASLVHVHIRRLCQQERSTCLSRRGIFHRWHGVTSVVDGTDVLCSRRSKCWRGCFTICRRSQAPCTLSHCCSIGCCRSTCLALSLCARVLHEQRFV